MSTGKQIRKYRKKLGWKLKDLEEVSGVESGTISALELRDSNRSQHFAAIAKAFGLTLEQLLDTETDWHVVDMRPQPKSIYPLRAEQKPLRVEDSDDRIRQIYIREANEILLKLDTQTLNGAVANLKTYIQNLGPPRNGQTLPMAV